MGNQQAKIDKLSWLGGIIDGEGCFHVALQSVKWRTQKDSKTGLFARPQIKLSNTYLKGLDDVINILKEQNIRHYVGHRYPTKINWKPSWYLSIVGLKGCLDFCSLMADYVVWKQEELQAMKLFCKTRIDRMSLGNCRGGFKNGLKLARFTETEIDCISKLRGRDKRLKTTDPNLKIAYLSASTTKC